MVRRQQLHPQAVQRRKSLLNALERVGGNTDQLDPDAAQLIAQRTVLFLNWAPEGVDNRQWLQAQLPEPWHHEVATTALGMTARRGGASAPATTVGNGSGVTSQARRRRRGR